jgi:hypothetical protein
MLWILEEEFRTLVSMHWKSYDLELEDFVCNQFVHALKVVKEKVVAWSMKYINNEGKIEGG